MFTRHLSVSNHYTKTVFKALFLLFGFFLVTQISSAQARYTLLISPESGPPGTTILLVPNPTYPDERCYADGQIVVNRAFTVPADASGRIGFHCETGSGASIIRSDTAVFYIIPPDTDGDGIPDSQDNCPTQYAETPDGCPVPEGNDPPPLPPENPSDIPQVPDEQTENIFAPPPLPNDGGCFVATRENVFVNVRQYPTTESEIVDSLDPSQTYPALGGFDDGENEWYWVPDFGGWVAGYVTRQNEACTSIPPNAVGFNLDDHQVAFTADQIANDLTNIIAFTDLIDIETIFDPSLLRALYTEYLLDRTATDEQRIRHFLEDACGIPWEPDGQFLFMMWTEDGYLQYFLDNLDTNPNDICIVAHNILDYFDNLSAVP